MSGICVQCDKCGVDFRGLPHHRRGLHWSQESTLRAEARELGWTGPIERGAKEPDFCPECSKSTGVHET
jgi:hypothetical protein